jgi:DNA repair protein RadC
MVQLPLLVREDSRKRMVSPCDAREICKDLENVAQESMHVLTLDGKNKLLNRHMVSLGTVDCVMVHPREVFRAAILDSASAVVIVHNHPSGDPAPSPEDLRITKQLVAAGRIVGIQVIDHVIIGRGATPFQSLREDGLVSFSMSE